MADYNRGSGGGYDRQNMSSSRRANFGQRSGAGGGEEGSGRSSPGLDRQDSTTQRLTSGRTTTTRTKTSSDGKKKKKNAASTTSLRSSEAGSEADNANNNIDEGEDIEEMRKRLNESRKSYRSAKAAEGKKRKTAHGGAGRVRRSSSSGVQDTYYDEDDDDIEEPLPLVQVAKPARPFQLGIVQPLAHYDHATSKDSAAALGGLLKILYLPSWDLRAPVRALLRSLGCTSQLLPALPLCCSCTGGGEPGQDVDEDQQEEEEEWLLQEEGLYYEKDPLKVSKMLTRSRLVSRMVRDSQVDNIEKEERREWEALERGEETKEETPKASSSSSDPLHRRVPLPPNPVTGALQRPDATISEDGGAHNLYTSAIRPTQPGVGGDPGGEMNSHQASLRIVLSRFALYDHPLFSTEDDMFGQIRLMFGDYRRRLEETSPRYLCSRLVSLTEGLEALKKDKAQEVMSDQDRLRLLKHHYDDALETLLELYYKEQDFRQLSKAIYDKWKELEIERVRSGFHRTPAHLMAYRIKSKPTKPALPEVIQNLAQELEWTLEEIGRLWATKENAFQKQMNQTTYNLYAQVDWAHESRRMTELLQAYEAIFPKDDQPDYLLKLSNDDETCLSGVGLTNTEIERREEIARSKYYAVILINGQVVSRTNPRSLEWPRFTLSFNKSLRVWLLRRPQSLCIQLWKKRFLLMDQMVASVMVPVPGQGGQYDHGNTHGIAPRASWYQWAAAEAMGPGALAHRRITGSMLVGLEWESGQPFVESNEPPVLPSRLRAMNNTRLQGLRPEEMAGECQEDGGETSLANLPDFEKEKDFLLMLPDLDHVDPNDPRNANLLRFRDIMLPSDYLNDRFRTAENYFQLCFFNKQGLYADHNRFEQPRRHELFRLRQYKPELFSGPIPISESAVRRDESYRSMIIAERKKYDEAELDKEDLEIRKTVDKAKLKDFVRRVRESRASTLRRAKKRRPPLASLVQEGFLPELNIYDLDLSFLLPAPPRALRPRPITRTPTTMDVKKCRILIQVVLARNLPLRKFGKEREVMPVSRSTTSPKKRRKRRNSDDDDDDDDGRDDDDGNEEEIKPRDTNLVNSYVEIRFQDQVGSTRIQQGRTPLWKESIHLGFVPPGNDFSPDNLAQVRDRVTLSVFDHVKIDDRAMGGYYPDEETVRTENRFLGCLSVPFTTIYLEGRVEGVFKLETPLVNLGYEQRALEVSQAQQEDRERDHDREENQRASTVSDPRPGMLLREAEASTYVSLMATLDPLLQTPIKDDKDFVDVKEDRGLVTYAQGWLQRVRNLTSFDKKRHMRLFVPSMSGERVFVLRYLRAQAPPPGITTVRQCVRFVSLIPFLEDWQTFVGEGDIWCTSQQFLDILAGDFEEHSLLLYNYLSYLSQRSKGRGGNQDDIGPRTKIFLVLGRGIPEGNTVYVMSLNEGRGGDAVLWNACTGDGYSSQDERCPLLDVGMLISEDNVYANLQQDGRPSKISLDLTDPLAWMPFFSPTTYPAPKPGKMASLQEATLMYNPTSKTFVLELEEQLLDTLKRYVRRWRARRTATSFNSEVSARLQELLPTLEKARLGDLRFSYDDHEQKLESILRSRMLFGMPLNMPFTEIGDIVQRVKATGTHDTKNPDAQFAIAVAIFPYTNNVLSVWVYFAMLAPRTSRMIR